ncbi:Activator of Hsp90 ATPase 1 family protein [Catenulispora acidiphila DSM 44928]|uniref:Activator of Hsp90 ATPase 1 family protein n=1 Tax=Catenulispora acidiphila (strain DSM 44928 / JCM 14897 / NBRC 102108 / NRRL B-24433 / ID139908) TaxID=479433 RepID=C7Q147_CATAD|nr:SRPBCC family protein [Catenulispora acidiphila]ACU71722.1 Activator of Hsp90 ATPase 1 family protein [Catenulispora acidiphila DSM 44928]
MTERFITHSTFVLERVYDAPVERVFAAWGDQEVKRRWFSPTMEVDFRVGGTERSTFRNQPDGPLFTYEAVFRDIVPNERIVLTNHMHSDQDRIAVNLVSIEFAPENDGTRVTITDHGTYLDGRDRGDWREEGVGQELDRLAIELRPTALTSTMV